MAKAFQFLPDGFNQDLVIEDKLQRAAAEIYDTYGDVVKINRKSLRKYGRNTAVGTGEFDITPFTVGAYTTIALGGAGANPIDSLSSGNAADTNVPVYLEGLVRTGNNLKFVTQVVNTDVSDGQTRVPLTTPYWDCTRSRALAQGDIWVYENTALTAGKPTDVTKINNQVVVGDRTSLKAATSFQQSNYFILLGYWATLGKASGAAAADIRVKLATLGNTIFDDNSFTEEVWSIALGSPPNGPPVDYEIVSPNSRLAMTASASSGTLDIKSGFYGFIADIVARRDQAGRIQPVSFA